MKVLVTGADGQLGCSIRKLENEYPRIKFTYTDIEDLNITNKGELETYFAIHKIDYLINCAAYNAVDKAEEEVDKARLINHTAVVYLAECADVFDFTMIHISTDYVLDGKHFRPYTEEDEPIPPSVYGRTKHAGEQAVLNRCKKGIVLRTSWLYSEYGNNFLKTMMRLADERTELKIIFDQIGTPTYGGDLAKAILELIKRKYSRKSLFHFSNEGVASWYDFAEEIILLSGKKCTLLPILTEEYPLPAKRPFYSLMSKRKFTVTFNYKIPHWKESVKYCLKNMNEID